jgi:hypothetical protein
MSNLWKLNLLFLLFALQLTSCAVGSATAPATAFAAIPSEQTARQTPVLNITRTETVTPGPPTKESPKVTTTPTPALEKTKRITQSQPTETDSISKEESSMMPILISVGNASFSAKLYDNETTRALLAQFPLSLNMSELNGKEKYYHFPENLPSPSTEKPATIHAGEIMLWSSNSLVLFYSTFSNAYGGYVRLGYVEEVTGLADSLGSGSVQVTFTVSK